MEDPLGSYPLASRLQGALFERNPVCALAYRVCMDMSEEYGGLQFNLMGSIEAADAVCRQLVRHAWHLAGVEHYLHQLQNRLDNNHAAVMCACATVSVSISVMANAPEPLRRLGHDMQGLVYSGGNRIMDTLRASVFQHGIILSAAAYGEMPAMPPALRERMELAAENNHLTRELRNMKKQLKTMEATQFNQYNAPIYNYNAPVYNAPVYQGCTFNDSHDTHYHNANPSAEKEQPPQRVEDVAFEEMHTNFCYITDKCAKNNMVEHVEAHLDIACKGTAEALWSCIHEFEFIGYLSTQNIDATKIYNALTEHFGALPFGVINFRKYR